MASLLQRVKGVSVLGSQKKVPNSHSSSFFIWIGPGLSKVLPAVVSGVQQQQRQLSVHEHVSMSLLKVYESFSDVGEIRVWFASKILTPCRMH